MSLRNKIISKSPRTKVVVSSLITRNDQHDAKGKIGKINKHLTRLSRANNFDLINNDNIDRRDLNKSGLHLNNHGNAQLAKNFINCINNF